MKTYTNKDSGTTKRLKNNLRGTKWDENLFLPKTPENNFEIAKTKESLGRSLDFIIKKKRLLSAGIFFFCFDVIIIGGKRKNRFK